MFATPLPFKAFGTVEQTNDYHGVSGECIAPAATVTGEGRLAGVAASGELIAPAATLGYSYGQVLYGGMSLAGTVGLADTSGGWDTIVYPSSTRRGDLALLFIGWEATVSAGPETPAGWTVVGSAVGPSSKPIGVLYAQIVVGSTDDLFPILVNNNRIGGGWLMTVYHKAVIDAANFTSGNGTSTTTIPLGNITIATTGNIAYNAVVTTGTPSYITSGGVTPPQEEVNSVEGTGGGGQASLWAVSEVKTLTGSQPQAAVTPSSSGPLSVNWARVTVPLTEIGQWHFIDPASVTAPAATASGTIQLTRHVSGECIAPPATLTGSGIVNRSGREVCADANTLNSVVTLPLKNSALTAPAQNSVVVTPEGKNEVC